MSFDITPLTFSSKRFKVFGRLRTVSGGSKRWRTVCRLILTIVGMPMSVGWMCGRGGNEGVFTCIGSVNKKLFVDEFFVKLFKRDNADYRLQFLEHRQHLLQIGSWDQVCQELPPLSFGMVLSLDNADRMILFLYN